MPRQFDFLESFIHNVLDEAGFEELSETTRNQFVPMFEAEAERRLGLNLLPLLNDKQSEELVKIAADTESNQENLVKFWQESIPNFEEVVKKTLDDFAVEFKQTLANIQK